ncbi:MAG: Prolyl endopeptidase [uncultured Acidimicrobiales bacterium]|uniref:Prolyl endopeptidase n=1 Tax=uncultured Acidimicrobiales bacterium TaxID=310071 RepID=A0A6J4HN73_9ACTN|nr:MAG: Prolyl endopeptidase [uncultured Acidimicrobiales bacterium]
MRYPDARRLDLVEDLHGRLVADPYRWLEEAGTAETAAWSSAQDELFAAWMAGVPGVEQVAARLRRLLPGMVGLPTVRGDRRFWFRRRPEEEHAVLVVDEGDGREQVVLDPMAIDPRGTTTLDGVSLSREGDRVAFQTSAGGDELSRLQVLDVATREVLEGPIPMGRTGDVAWLPGGEELFYVRRLGDDERPPGEDHFHRRVWRHRVGADPGDDELVFGEGRDKGTYYGVRTSEDGHWLLVSAAVGTEPRNDLLLGDLRAPDLELVAVHEGVDAQTWGEVGVDGLLYLRTDLGSPRGRLVVASPDAPGPDGWRDLLPEGEAVLEDWALADGVVVAVHQRHVVSEVGVFDRSTGAPLSSITLPGLGTASVRVDAARGNDVWVGYADHLTPSRVLHHDLAAGRTRVHAVPPGDVEVLGARATQAFVASTDGAEVPLFILAKDDVVLDGTNPTVLYGYGGFNVPLVPAWSPAAAAWVEAGGVWCVANLRGGSEYGEAWHRDGMREHKQHVFDDLLACADHLCGAGWTSAEHLGISGGSNGGLLVGAALTQSPERFAAVLCSAPLLDMVRYERFGLGVTWNDEYGTAEDAEELGWLLAYSPYHRVVEGTRYPSVLFTTFDNDSRVDPLHARKLCAALQWATSAPAEERPVLLRREREVGHGARSVSRSIELGADTLAWQAERLGLRWPDVDGP